MVKEFANWVSDMANSIEDASTHKVEDTTKVVKPLSHYTCLEIRKEFADRVCNYIADPTHWMAALLSYSVAGKILGPKLQKVWQETDRYDAITFVTKIRKLIELGVEAHNLEKEYFDER